MANTIAVNSTHRGSEQFQGLFSDIWTITATISDQDAVALTDSLELDMTVAGLVLGDVVIGASCSVDFSDGTDQAAVTYYVSAANTVTMQILADKGEFAADALNTGVIKLVVGRPTW